MNNAMKEHWNKIYSSNDIRGLGWYEETPAPSIKLLSKCDIGKEAAILDVGAGATTLIDYLISDGYTNITAADISEAAIGKLKERLGEEKSALVKWIVDDISQPEHISQLRDVALWHDRAVLHFLLEESQRQTYFSTLKKVVKKDGYAIIAAFSMAGAKKCSGLDVVNYDCNMLSERLGDNFELIEAFDYVYHTPSGNARPYIYTLFRKKVSLLSR